MLRGQASIRQFKISAVPPGSSWFAFDSDGKSPETPLLSIWFLDNGMRTWSRSRDGTLVETTKEQRWEKGRDAGHASLHHGDAVAVLELDDAFAAKKA